MIPFSLNELASFTKDELITLNEQAQKAAELKIDEVSTSTKSIHGKCLFVPLKGERFDAHSFIKEALQEGISALVISKDIAEVKSLIKDKCKDEQEFSVFENKLESLPILKCTDTQRLLGLASQLVRLKSHALVAAITGSCGKTTAKEMTAAILNVHSDNKCLYTQGNFNNDVGVPLTLLRFDNVIDYAVVEQGASHLKDIARTAEFVKADFALITNVGEAHIEGFGSRRGVYLGKSEILDELFKNYKDLVEDEKCGCLKGCAVVCADSPWFSSWQEDYKEQFNKHQLLSFGESNQATMQVSNIVENENGQLSFSLQVNEERLNKRFKPCNITLQMLGRHNAINFAGAALLALLMGANEQDIVKGAQVLSTTNGRLAPEHFAKFTVIDDAYNASFNSVIAAIDTLSKQKGFRIFAFGQMGELGSAAEELHTKVGEYAANKIDLLITYGELAKLSSDKMIALGGNAMHAQKHDEINDTLSKLIASKDYCTCLVKGSHATHMEKVVAFLKEHCTKL